MSADTPLFWRLPPGQRLLCEDFTDGIVMYDALVGATHLLNATAAETLALIEEAPGMSGDALYRRLLARLSIGSEALPVEAVEELLWRLEHLNLIAATPA